MRSVDQTPPEVFRIDFEEARRVHEDLHDRAMSICRGAGESPSKIVERDIAEARGIDQGADDGRVPSFRRAVEKLPEIAARRMNLQEVSVHIPKMESVCELVPAEDLEEAARLLLRRLKEERYL